MLCFVINTVLKLLCVWAFKKAIFDLVTVVLDINNLPFIFIIWFGLLLLLFFVCVFVCFVFCGFFVVFVCVFLIFGGLFSLIFSTEICLLQTEYGIDYNC